MKPALILITTITAMAAAHGEIVGDPGVNGRRQLLGRALALAPRQGDGVGPYVGPINPPGGGDKKRQNEDGAGPYAGPEVPGAGSKKRQTGDGAGPYEGELPPDAGSKKRQENQAPPGAFGGTVPSGGASRIKQRREIPDPVVAARQAESTGTGE